MNAADTAWMLISTALVLLMTPALAFFYGGLVRSKNALNTMMMSFISLGFVGVLWAADRLLARVRGRARTGSATRPGRCCRGLAFEPKPAPRFPTTCSCAIRARSRSSRRR